MAVAVTLVNQKPTNIFFVFNNFHSVTCYFSQSSIQNQNKTLAPEQQTAIGSSAGVFLVLLCLSKKRKENTIKKFCLNKLSEFKYDKIKVTASTIEFEFK